MTELYEVTALETREGGSMRTLLPAVRVEAESGDQVFFWGVGLIKNEYPDLPTFYDSVSVVVRNVGALDAVLYSLVDAGDPSAVGIVDIGGSGEPDEHWLPPFDPGQ